VGTAIGTVLDSDAIARHQKFEILLTDIFARGELCIYSNRMSNSIWAESLVQIT